MRKETASAHCNHVVKHNATTDREICSVSNERLVCADANAAYFASRFRTYLPRYLMRRSLTTPSNIFFL